MHGEERADLTRYASLMLASRYRVLHEHCNRHWSYSAWNGSDRFGSLRDFIESHVAYQSKTARSSVILHPINSDVDDDRTFADMFGPQKLAAANGRDENVSGECYFGQVSGTRMSHRDRRITATPFLHQ
jgi:hypothetical protein